MVRMWEQTSLLGRQEKKHASVWKRTPFSKCSLLRKENSCIPFTGCKTGSLLRMDRKRWGPDVEYWLDSSNTCRPHLIPHHTLRATSGLLCHRDVLHGLHTLHTYPLCLTRVWGLLTGPLEISFNRKMTPNGQKRKKKKNTSSTPAILCGLQLPLQMETNQSPSLTKNFHIWQEHCTRCWGGGLLRNGRDKGERKSPDSTFQSAGC